MEGQGRYQRYAEPVAHARMDGGGCPECGAQPDAHGWGANNCSLREDGVVGRIAQYRSDRASDDASLAPLLAAPVRFWACPEHRRTGRVEWREATAYCMAEGCGRRSDDASNQSIYR
jgi:hypothetical protein